MSELRPREFRRILLIKPSALGDVVHTLPILVKLRARYPQAQIDWLVTPENADLVRHHPALSNAVLFPRRTFARFGRDWTATRGMLGLLAQLRRTRYDLVVDLHGQARSALFALATGSKHRVGFAKCREGAWLAYSHRIPVPSMEHHAVDRSLWLAPLLGLDDAPPDFTIHLPADIEAKTAARLADLRLDRKPLAILAPGTVWETKHWPPDRFAEVARHLLADGYGVALIGAGGDKPRCEVVASACPAVCDLSGRTSLAELVALIRRAALCVTNDSGSMHLAVALGRPVVSVFGPTNPVRTGPYRRPEAVVRADLACSPCYLRTLRRCPHNHRCMTDVSPEMVLDRTEQVTTAARSEAA